MAEPASRDGALERLALAAVGAVALTAERVDELAGELAERGGMRRDEARQLLEDSVTRWRGDATRLGERAGENLPACRTQLGLVTAGRAGRARAARRPARAPPAARRGRALRSGALAAACVQGQRFSSRACNMGAWRSLRHAQPRAHLGDRPGRRPARVRLLLRDPQADRPAAVAADAAVSLEVEAARPQRGQHLREMLDELGPTFVKFGQLLSTRPDIVPPDIIAELRRSRTTSRRSRSRRSSA